MWCTPSVICAALYTSVKQTNRCIGKRLKGGGGVVCHRKHHRSSGRRMKLRCEYKMYHIQKTRWRVKDIYWNFLFLQTRFQCSAFYWSRNKQANALGATLPWRLTDNICSRSARVSAPTETATLAKLNPSQEVILLKLFSPPPLFYQVVLAFLL